MKIKRKETFVECNLFVIVNTNYKNVSEFTGLHIYCEKKVDIAMCSGEWEVRK